MSDLRALAEAATPGPWYVKDLYHGGPVIWQGTDFDHQTGYEAVAQFSQLYGAAPNAAYIAAASPDRILALLDVVDAARSVDGAWRLNRNAYDIVTYVPLTTLDEMYDRLKALRTALDRLP